MKVLLRKIKKRIKWHLKIKKRLWGYKYRQALIGRKIQNVVFICSYPQGWNSLKTIYKAAIKRTDINTFLVASVGFKYNELNPIEFWKEIDSNVYITDEKNVFDITKLHPDLIFRQEPYDEVYPLEYAAEKLCQISRLCYVPYGYNPSPVKHLEIEYNDAFFDFCYSIFADSHTAYRFCKSKAAKSPFYSNIRLYECGFPRFDLMGPIKEIYEYKKYLWIPRWSLDSIDNDKSGFFDYIENFLDYFQKNNDLSLEIRPHPAMFKNFVKRNAMTEDEVKSFKEKIACIPNISLDESADYIPAFQRADVLIADFSSLDIEFGITGKPIVYCGDMREFNDETREMANNFYTAHNWDELFGCIEMLKSNNDPFKLKRIEVARAFRKSVSSKNIGESILQRCFD